MVRKLVLIEQGTSTRIVITLVITSVNQPMHITMPPTTLIFVLGGATTADADAEHDGHAHGHADRDHHSHHGSDADAGGDQPYGCDQHTDPGPDRSRSHPLVT